MTAAEWSQLGAHGQDQFSKKELPLRFGMVMCETDLELIKTIKTAGHVSTYAMLVNAWSRSTPAERKEPAIGFAVSASTGPWPRCRPLGHRKLSRR